MLANCCLRCFHSSGARLNMSVFISPRGKVDDVSSDHIWRSLERSAGSVCWETYWVVSWSLFSPLSSPKTPNNTQIKKDEVFLHFAFNFPFFLNFPSFFFVLETAPKLKPIKNPTLVNEGSKLTVKCEATGNPAPSYRWYKDGNELQKSGKVKIRNTKWVQSTCTL